MLPEKRVFFCSTIEKTRQAFRTNLPDTTKIIIAQRIISVMDADLIVVMDDGEIVDMGTLARAMQSRCFCPPETLTPPWPRSVS